MPPRPKKSSAASMPPRPKTISDAPRSQPSMMAMFKKPADSSRASAALAQEALPGGPPRKKLRSEDVDEETSAEVPKKLCSDDAVDKSVDQPASTEDKSLGGGQLDEKHEEDETPVLIKEAKKEAPGG